MGDTVCTCCERYKDEQNKDELLVEKELASDASESEQHADVNNNDQNDREPETTPFVNNNQQNKPQPHSTITQPNPAQRRISALADIDIGDMVHIDSVKLIEPKEKKCSQSFEFLVQYDINDPPSNTAFAITTSADTHSTNPNTQSFILNAKPSDHKHYHWALFKSSRRIYHLCRGYFTILEDDNNEDKKERINSTHLNAFLQFVHDTRIRDYLRVQRTQCGTWVHHDISIDIDKQQYTLKFFNGKNIKQCQSFYILKHIKEKQKTQNIYALYFPEPRPSIQWKWYDNQQETKFVPYDEDPVQTLQFEASYYANNPANFPLSNPMFRSQHNTSIFDHCYLKRLSLLLSQKSQEKKAKYCMRYTINVIGDHGEYEIGMDQLRIHKGNSNFARTVIRYFDRVQYLRNIHNRIPSVATRAMVDIPPMHTEHGSLEQKDNALKWVAYFDADASKGNKYVFDIKRNQEVDMSTLYAMKERQLSQMMVKVVCIKEGDLVSNRCKQSYKDVDYIWAKFKSKKSKYCELVNGYWDISFHDDDKCIQLRDHLDAICSVLQNFDVQEHIVMNKADGSFFGNEDNDEKSANDNNNNVLYVTIDEKKYEVLWYNTLPIRLKVARTHTMCIKCIHETSSQKMYIMYFPKPQHTQHKWQWYNNNNCVYIDYKHENELLQLECSYLANLGANYPTDIIKDNYHRNIRYFSHCLFTTLRKNLKTRKRYVLRYEEIAEAENKLIVEQLAYSSKDNYFEREVQRISENELHEEHDSPPLRPKRAISIGKSSTEVMERLTEILISYHQWLCSRSDLRKDGMLAELKTIYKCKDNESAITKLQNDFNLFMKQRDSKILKEDQSIDDEMAQISDIINPILTKQFKHESTKCVCVERAYADRTPNGADSNSKERYFGFSDPKEIVVQQTLDSYHCFFVHNYDIKTGNEPFTQRDESLPSLTSRQKIPMHMSTLSPKSSLRQSSILSFSPSIRNRSIFSKFNTYDTYDTGIRFYYWVWYKDRAQKIVKYQDRVTDPGNDKNNGKKYKFCDWFVVPAAANLKEEILSFGDGSLIGMDQYNILHQKVVDYLNTEHAHQLHCDTTDWENKYGLKYGAAIRYEHVLALRYYCCFTEAADKFRTTFIKLDENESDEALKKRHSKCALWSMYLRESVEGFGTRLKRGRGVPSEYYRGITKKFLFKKTILRFNLPTSTSVTPVVAENFARNAGGDGDGLTLLLKPHWGDYGGYIRAMNCSTFTDYQWEEEYLFIGGLEPLVIHNITEVNDERTNYFKAIQAMNNIYQIFEGMACKFKMKRTLIEQFINNRLNGNRMNDDYMTPIFDFYCDDLRSVTIKLSLMDKSYKGIANIFIDSFNSNELRLEKIIKLFPNCERVTICDGYNYQLMPTGAAYDSTILCVIEKCILYANKHRHSLENISLQSPEQIDADFLNICKRNIAKMGWFCKQQNALDPDENEDSSDESVFRYTICKRK